MSSFHRLCARLAGFAAGLMVAAAGLMAIGVLAQATSGDVFLWVCDLARLCLVWGVMLSMAWLLGAHRFLTVDLLADSLSGAARLLCDGLALVIVAFFALVVFVEGIRLLLGIGHISAIDVGEASVLAPVGFSILPGWLGSLSVPVGAGLLLFRVLDELCLLVLQFFRTQPGGSR